MAIITTYIYPIFRPTISFVPPVRVIGYFTGCPFPLMPVLRISPPIVQTIVTRLYIRPYIVPRPWYIIPQYRYPIFFFR